MCNVKNNHIERKLSPSQLLSQLIGPSLGFIQDFRNTKMEYLPLQLTKYAM